MGATRQVCTFYVEKLFFGVDVLKVQEVILYQGMTRAPLAHQAVRGLINLRGQIVTAVDLRQCLGSAPYGVDDRPMNVVVRNNEETVSLLVDQIGDVLDVGEESFESLPETVQGPARQVISGVHKLEGRLLLLLDTEKAMSLLVNGTDWGKAA